MELHLLAKNLVARRSRVHLWLEIIPPVAVWYGSESIIAHVGGGLAGASGLRWCVLFAEMEG